MKEQIRGIQMVAFRPILPPFPAKLAPAHGWML